MVQEEYYGYVYWYVVGDLIQYEVVGVVGDVGGDFQVVVDGVGVYDGDVFFGVFYLGGVQLEEFGVFVLVGDVGVGVVFELGAEYHDGVLFGEYGVEVFVLVGDVGVGVVLG